MLCRHLLLKATARDGGNQFLSVRSCRALENVAGLALFDGLALLEHQHLMSDAGNHRQIMRNQYVGHSGFGLQLDQQVENLRLYRDVQRRHWLIEQQQIRLQRQRSGDCYALALPA